MDLLPAQSFFGSIPGNSSEPRNLKRQPSLPRPMSVSNFSSGGAPVPESVARFPCTSPPPASHRTLSKGYLFVNGLHLGTAMLEVALTRHCIANHTCREANPLMPSSAGGQISVDLALAGYISWFSYEMKKHQSRSWWCAPMIGSAAHAVGTETGMTHF